MGGRNHVAKGREHRERRYVSAVRRQIAMVEHSNRTHAPYWYADPTEMLRRGDTLARFRSAEPLPEVQLLGSRLCGCRWRYRGESVVFTARCAEHAVMCRGIELWELDMFLDREPVTYG